MRAVLRPLLLLLIAVTVLLAVVTTTGRVLVAVPAATRTADSTRFCVSSGIELAASRALASVESRHPGRTRAIRRRPCQRRDARNGRARKCVAQRADRAPRVGGVVELTPVQGADGHWSLGPGGKGGAGEPCSWICCAIATASVSRTCESVFMPAARLTQRLSGEVHARVSLANAALHHSGEFVVRVEHGGSGEISLLYDVSQGVFGSPTSGRIALRSDHLALTPAFGVALGGGGATIERLPGHWSFAEGSSTGALKLSARRYRAADRRPRRRRRRRARVDGSVWTALDRRVRSVAGARRRSAIGQSRRHNVCIDAGSRRQRTPGRSVPPFDACAVCRRRARGRRRNKQARRMADGARSARTHRCCEMDGSTSSITRSVTPRRCRVSNSKTSRAFRTCATAPRKLPAPSMQLEIAVDDKEIALGFLNFYDAPFRSRCRVGRTPRVVRTGLSRAAWTQPQRGCWRYRLQKASLRSAVRRIRWSSGSC